MAENKLADMSTEFAIQILKLTENIKGHYSLSNQLYCSFTNKDNRTVSSKWEMRSDFSFCTESWMRTHKKPAGPYPADTGPAIEPLRSKTKSNSVIIKTLLDLITLSLQRI